jgi:hypothetical protein
LNVADILSLCFTPSALRFILTHAYNDYLLFQHVSNSLQNLPGGSLTFPIGLKHVRKQLLSKTPFGELHSQECKDKVAQLNKLTAGNGGRFNPEESVAGAFAFDLIHSGFLLVKKEDETNSCGKLVVNPMWIHLLRANKV